MANRKPCDRIEIFRNAYTDNLKNEMNKWLEANPDFYLDQMTMTQNDNNYYTVICDFCLREGVNEEEEEEEEEVNLTDELLKGLIIAVNELTDTVKTLTDKKENI